MKYIALFLSTLSLTFSYLSYQKTKELESLKPLAQVVSIARGTQDSPKEKSVKAIKEMVSTFLVDLANEIKKSLLSGTLIE